MGAAKREIEATRANHRLRRRRRKIAAAASALLLVPAVVSGEPMSQNSRVDYSAMGYVGNGLIGLTDPRTVGADGKLHEDDRIGADLLRDAGDPDKLAQEGLELPSGPLGIPGVMLQAYQKAAETMRTLQPTCNIHWSLLAAIGRVESGHAGGGKVFSNGDTVRAILGPVLNGGGFAAIADTDGGALDGDTRWDRAVGPMQFIPSTWKGYASDGNGDRVSSPHNVFDAALASAKYLCSGGLDLSNPQQRATAVFRYNHSDSYVRTVLIWADAYAKGVTPLPSTPVQALPMQQGSVGTVNPGTGAPQNPGAPQDPGNPGGQPQNPSTPNTSPTPPPPDPDPTCPPTSTTPPPTSTTPSTPPTTTTPPADCEDPTDPSEPSTPSEPPTPSEPSTPPSGDTGSEPPPPSSSNPPPSENPPSEGPSSEPPASTPPEETTTGEPAQSSSPTGP